MLESVAATKMPAMPSNDTDRLGRLLARHQELHDPAREPRNGLRWLPELQRWQAARLKVSFRHFLHDERRAPAAEFFLSDVYGDRDCTRRNADIARVVPMMRRLLPKKLLGTVADAIELGVVTQELDLHMAEALETLAPRRRKLDDALYGEAYRRVGRGFGEALRMRGVAALLAFSRGPAKLAGLGELQGFLERGYAAFEALDDAAAFVDEIERDEREVSRRLFAGEDEPFAFD